jgi:hypothetical protein
MELTKAAVFEVWCWQYSRTGCFNNMLFDLIQKADPGNKLRLARAFPLEMAAYQAWCEAGNYGEDLFKEWGIRDENAPTV